MELNAQLSPEPVPEAGPELPVTRIRPSRGWVALGLGELWDYRELLWFLVWRDVKVRYKQTVLGAAWALVQPLAAMAIFTIFFGRLAQIPSENVPYSVFAFAGLTLWLFFATGVTQAANSLVAGASLVTKVYFPRLLMPVSAVLAGAIDLALASGLLIGLAVVLGVTPPAQLPAAPLFVLLAFATALGAGLWLAALNVQYRDVRHVVPFLTQIWLFATPVAYPSSLLDEPWRTLYGVNPMAGAVEGFRWAVLGTPAPPGGMIALSVAVSGALLVGGAFYFRRTEKTFADVI
jgi:lipopolysaccharide transport system permease protein